jgi:hypothetical protein
MKRDTLTLDVVVILAVLVAIVVHLAGCGSVTAAPLDGGRGGAGGEVGGRGGAQLGGNGADQGAGSGGDAGASAGAGGASGGEGGRGGGAADGGPDARVCGATSTCYACPAGLRVACATHAAPWVCCTQAGILSCDSTQCGQF